MKTLVVLGHPNPDSFCAGLYDAFVEGAKESDVELRTTKVHDLNFDPVLRGGYNAKQQLEPDLVEFQDNVLWADHLVFIYPIWWGGIPSILKGLIDRTFLPGFAFKYRENSQMWDKLLSGRTAQLLVTLDTPPWYFRWVYGRPGHNQMRRTILGFCGVKVKSLVEFAPITGSSDEKRAGWLVAAKRLGKQIQ